MLKRYLFVSSVAAILCLACAGLAQERPAWGPTVWFKNGMYIQTGIGSVPAGDTRLTVSNTSVSTAPSVAPGTGTFRRILRLSDGRAIIYEIIVKRLDDGRRFEVSLGPWMPTQEAARALGVDPARVEANFLGSYSAPLTVEDGDTLALDVLVNPRTGVKLVDYFRITARPPVVRASLGDLSAAARQIGIRDVELSVENFELLCNGNSVYASKGGVTGRFIWIDVPQTGRFIFSLSPGGEEDGFRRAAYVTRRQIIFVGGADKYEWVSERPVVPASGVFHLWVRFEPAFTPPPTAPPQNGNAFSVGAADSLPIRSKRE